MFQAVTIARGSQVKPLELQIQLPRKKPVCEGRTITQTGDLFPHHLSDCQGSVTPCLEYLRGSCFDEMAVSVGIAGQEQGPQREYSRAG